MNPLLWERLSPRIPTMTLRWTLETIRDWLQEYGEGDLATYLDEELLQMELPLLDHHTKQYEALDRQLARDPNYPAIHRAQARIEREWDAKVFELMGNKRDRLKEMARATGRHMVGASSKKDFARVCAESWCQRIYKEEGYQGPIGLVPTPDRWPA